jgi:hypothetical protein
LFQVYSIEGFSFKNKALLLPSNLKNISYDFYKKIFTVDAGGFRFAGHRLQKR